MGFTSSKRCSAFPKRYTQTSLRPFKRVGTANHSETNYALAFGIQFDKGASLKRNSPLQDHPQAGIYREPAQTGRLERPCWAIRIPNKKKRHGFVEVIISPCVGQRLHRDKNLCLRCLIGFPVKLVYDLQTINHLVSLRAGRFSLSDVLKRNSTLLLLWCNCLWNAYFMVICLLGAAVSTPNSLNQHLSFRESWRCERISPHPKTPPNKSHFSQYSCTCGGK